MRSRLITAIALSLLLAACIAVAVNWATSNRGGDSVDLSTGTESALTESSGSSGSRGVIDSTGGRSGARIGESSSSTAGSDSAGAGAAQDQIAAGGSPDSAPAAPAAGGTDPAATPAEAAPSSEQSTTLATQPVAPSTASTPPTPPPPPRLAVFGVAHDDVLNVRAAPGSGNSVILRLSPIEDGVAASGTSRLLAGTSLWYEVEARGVTGWAAAEFLLYRGPTKDLTSYVVGQAGGYPEASSMPELGQLVASTLADPRSRIVMSVGPSVGDLGQVTYDVVGLGDGSVGGLRVTVLGQPAEGGGQFSLKSVEATDFCLRGGSPSQRCA